MELKKKKKKKYLERCERVHVIIQEIFPCDKNLNSLTKCIKILNPTSFTSIAYPSQKSSR